MTEDGGIGLSNYIASLTNDALIHAIGNSFKVSGVTAIITTTLAFALAYAVNCTKIYQPLKGAVKIGILIPVLIPTITYGYYVHLWKSGVTDKAFWQKFI